MHPLLTIYFLIIHRATSFCFVLPSAGIGRTGTYIAIESLLDQARAEDTVDVVRFISSMRGQRRNMIQTSVSDSSRYDILVTSADGGASTGEAL